MCATAGLLLAACMDPDPAPTPPRLVRAVTSTSPTGTVGAPVPGGVTVQVLDYSDRAVAGARVAFTLIAGDGAISTPLVISDGDGLAHVEWTLGETAGTNELVASIWGVDSTTHFVATGNAGAATGLAMTPQVVRIAPTASGGLLAARIVDQFGNELTGTPAYTSRNPSLVTVDNAGSIAAVESNPDNRGGSTYIVVTAGGFTDSAAVYTLSTTDPPCTGITATAPLNVGDVQVTGFADNGVCIPAAAGEREYALVPFFESRVPAAQTVLSVAGVGIKATASQSLAAVRSRRNAPRLNVAAVFERKLRLAERRELAPRAGSVRQWFARRAVNASRRATLATTPPAVGDYVELNVEADSFCSAPRMRTGRIVAVTNHAVILADTLNPPGYSDADYAAFGATFDTLVYPIDLTNFGEPTDIDENGRALILFTHAVNEEGFGILGYAYGRDLLPRSGPLGSCPGSNLAEILYIRVPDGLLSVSSARLDVVATMAHELQHVINAGRRLLVNQNANPTEEVWLNEGLSHIAEELAFYRASGLGPRQNLGTQLSAVPSAFRQYAFQNFERYFIFTSAPGSEGPVGLNGDDDDAATRGAAWSFLRFAADHRAAANESALWQSLVNSSSSGLPNLSEHLGPDVRLLIRDWALSNFMDNLVASGSPYDQPSWNLWQVPGFRSPSVLDLVAPAQTTPTSASTPVTLGALSSEFVRFAVGANQEAYIGATGFPANSGTPLARHVLLAIARTR
jgi:hypothetical protein